MITNKLYLNKGLYDNKNIFENTIEAIKGALKLKLGLYLTVRETKDHVFIIYEDSNLSRLQNIKDKISDMTYDDLEYISYYHIPKLEEVLKLINGKVDIIFDLKIKNKKIFEILKNYQGKYVVIANSKIIYEINKNYSFIKVGEIITKKLNISLFSFFIKLDFKSYDLTYYSKVKHQKYKEAGNIIIGYKAYNKETYEEFKNAFDYLVIDNYQNLGIK